MAKDIQIGADVTGDLRDRVLAYAEELHLAESGLVNLLVARELRLKRLGGLQRCKAVKRSASRFRLTGRQNTPSLREDFQAHVAALGIDRADALVSLVEAEIRERWLWKSLDFDVESN
jgi:hypothetical protein